MSAKNQTVDTYINALPVDRKNAMVKLRETIKNNLPKGFEEEMSYGMPGYVVPHSIYPSGYHVTPELPLPFISIASQKNFIALYHMGIYSDPELLAWFKSEYPKHCSNKLDMGKSCIRFKNISKIPYDLIGELARKMTVDEWVERYENNLK